MLSPLRSVAASERSSPGTGQPSRRPKSRPGPFYDRAAVDRLIEAALLARALKRLREHGAAARCSGPENMRQGDLKKAYRRFSQHRGEYCMARPRDQGIYEPGNVAIVLTTVNIDEARKPTSEATKDKIGAKARRRLREGSPHREELRAIRRSPAMRRLVSRNSKAAWARRRAEARS